MIFFVAIIFETETGVRFRLLKVRPELKIPQIDSVLVKTYFGIEICNFRRPVGGASVHSCRRPRFRPRKLW